MFEWLNKQGVKAEAGYVLQRMHRFYYHYVEGDHVLKVDVESNLKGEVIFLDSDPHWESPHEDDPIPSDKLKEIEERICDALRFMGIRYKILKA
jgi:hypothetical protein